MFKTSDESLLKPHGPSFSIADRILVNAFASSNCALASISRPDKVRGVRVFFTFGAAGAAFVSFAMMFYFWLCCFYGGMPEI